MDRVKDVGNSKNKGNPLGISYHTKYIQVGEGGLHASTVLAREWRKGKCQYYIRNSWGRGCNAYNKNVDCKYNEGSFWVDDERFFEMSTDFTYIDQ